MKDRNYCYDFPRPALTVDIAVFRRVGERTEILLVRRMKDPFAGRFALPGGFVDDMEPLEHAARRELSEETGLVVETVDQLRAYGEPGRDPRGHTVSVAHVAVTDDSQTVSGNDDASEARWFPIEELPDLAFDHDRIARDAIAWLRRRDGSSEGEEHC
ncbi:MAG: NUDIX hydrolase [Acidobacteria bacterium]|nr:NUDIX hydrolase [Acidobacteriota bacterium]